MTAHRGLRFFAYFLFALVWLVNGVLARSPRAAATEPPPAGPKNFERQDDSFIRSPAKDLTLRPEGARKADALAYFVEGTSFEESAETDKALEAYRKVLNVDPGQSELAGRVAVLLSRQDNFPQAIDVLKDAIKANSKDPGPYLQLAFIYAKYLKKTDEAVDYANRAINLDPRNIDAYQRLFEIQLAAGEEKKALQSLDRALKVQSDDPGFWSRLGKLYASILFKSESGRKPADMERVSAIFKKAAEHGGDDPNVLKDVADFYAASQQINEAIPLYLRVLELQPDDANAREKLATGFVLTNQRAKATEMLEQIIREHPEKYQPYELLAQVLDDEARAAQRENQPEKAKAAFAKAAANYEQCILINPTRATTYLRLAELLLGPAKAPERAVTVLSEARQRFSSAPEIVYYLALAQREAKQTQEALATFAEALHEAELEDSEIVNAKFYFQYGATAEQAGLYEKAADLFRKSIALDPANSADACNYLGYMWAEHNIHLDEAETMIKRALETEPNNGPYLDSLGWVEFGQGKFVQALTDLQRAVENMSRDDSVVFDHLGDTYLKLNRVPQALEAWQKALIIDPENKKLAEKIDNAKTKMSKGQPATPIR
ncbi:MAG: tetratricopeptide repeat protein [Verrucomicrobiota bacterium]